MRLCRVSDALLARAAKSCSSAGNKCRELLNLTFKDAVAQGCVSNNPVPSTKPYKRKKPTITVLNKEQMKMFLDKASENNWYLEILLGLFLGLRKGEISGLKVSDIDFQNNTLTIARQITSNPIVEIGESKIKEYQIIEKEPKTINSYRTLKVPPAVMDEIKKRKMENDCCKEKMGDVYVDNGYLSCTSNGLPHGVTSFNQALTKL
jgi:integrase